MNTVTKSSLPHGPDGARDTRPVFGYIRVSSNQQEIARQESTIPEAHSKLPDGLHESELILFTDEGISAFKDKARPGFEELHARITSGEASALIVDTSSRLTRKGIQEAVTFLFTLQNHETRLFTTQGREYPPDLSGLISLAVDAERDNGYSRDLAHNVKTGRERIAALGGWSGGPAPIGYRTERHETGCLYLVPDEHAPVIREAFERYANGQGVYSVSVFLAQSLPSWPRNKSSDPNRVRHAARRMLRNRTYLGLIPRRQDDEYLPGLHEALVDEETFERCQAHLDSNSRDWQALRPIQSFGNQLRCGACDARAEFHRPNPPFAYYRCTNPACRLRKATASYVEAAFVFGLAQCWYEINEGLQNPSWAVTKTSADELGAIEQEVEELKTNAETILDAIISGQVPNDHGRKRLAENKARLERCETRQHLLADDGKGLRAALTQTRDFLLHFSAIGVITSGINPEEGIRAFGLMWGRLGADERREVVSFLIDTIKLHEKELEIVFRAGITVNVPYRAGRRDRRLAPALESLGFGRPPRSLRDFPPEVVAAAKKLWDDAADPAYDSASSHPSTADFRAVGAFSQ